MSEGVTSPAAIVSGDGDATFLVVSSTTPTEDVINALQASADTLGHDAAAFVALDKLVAEDPAQALGRLVCTIDPWTVVALDGDSEQALRVAFGKPAAPLDADESVQVCGYTLVAVPNFEQALVDQDAKRVAWGRLQAARHPGKVL
ncbi:MAG: hypothetical protein LUD25_02115 [Coriobacteriaceae bacterium]|nr:hypothetical protein [Coriobacteriaceae bacterium]